MEVKRFWASPQTQKGGWYGLRVLGAVLGITLLAVVLTVGGTALTVALDLPLEGTLLALCLGVAVVVILLAIRMGRGSARDATVFFLTEENRLYVWDARLAAVSRGGMVGMTAGVMRTQALLRQLAARPALPAGAVEILKVERIRERRAMRCIRCQMRRPNGRVVRMTCFLAEGIPDSDLLLRELERRQSWEDSLETPADHNSLGILLSLLACAGLAAVCVLSHPAVGRLPQAVYFPCLGAAFAALVVLVYFAVRQYRGE